jgi:hypothetical protein
MEISRGLEGHCKSMQDPLHFFFLTNRPMQLLTPVLDAVLSPKASRHREVLQLFRLYGECTVLITFKTHTDATLEKMRLVLEKLATFQKVRISAHTMAYADKA